MNYKHLPQDIRANYFTSYDIVTMTGLKIAQVYKLLPHIKNATRDIPHSGMCWLVPKKDYLEWEKKFKQYKELKQVVMRMNVELSNIERSLYV